MATTSASASSSEQQRLVIKQQLIERGIQLWKPPYYGVRHHAASLLALGKTVWTSLDETTTTTPTTLHQVQAHLEHFRDRALDKLRAKNKLLDCLHIKVLGTVTQATSTGDATPDVEFPETWAQHVSTSTSTITVSTTTTTISMIVLHHVNPNLTVTTLVQDLARVLHVPAVRLVCQGKTLLPLSLGHTRESSVSLTEQLLAGGIKHSAKVLCLVPPQQQRESTTSTTAVVVSPQSQQPALPNHPTSTLDDDQSLVTAMPIAATQLERRLDITDGATGSLVAVASPAQRVAFLTALGLHAVAVARMEQEQWQQALVLLLAANNCWEEQLVNTSNSNWHTRVDNYGLLQLDICWTYLKLQSLDDLPAVVQRLAAAEAVLRHQVHVNFVTLALVQAELERPVPAVAAMFVRLFLLQGIAAQYQAQQQDNKNNSSTATRVVPIQVDSRERLDWAYALAKSLRAVSPPEVVARLLQAVVHATPTQAIQALRHTAGNVDQAADRLYQSAQQAAQVARDRQKQRTFGMCQNGSDYCDLAMVRQLQIVLGLDSSDNNGGSATSGGGDNDSDNDEGQMLASGLLRLANNNLERALDIFNQDCLRDPSTVRQRVSELDERQGVRCKRSRVDNSVVVVVDEMALASLVSMGVDETTAKAALQANSNNVEMALLWLTTTTTTATTTNTANNDDVDRDDALQRASSSQDDTSTTMEEHEEDKPLSSVDMMLGTHDDNNNSSSLDDVNRSGAAFTLSAQKVAEQQAVELLERILGQVLEKQAYYEGYLGSTLDEEWGYIQQYRQSS